MAKYTYPAVFEEEKSGGYSIYFPDLDGCFSQGDDISDGMYMAEDALALMLYHMEASKQDIPAPSTIDSVKHGSNSFVTYVMCDTLEYQKRNNKRAVKKTLSIPEWMNEAAIAANLNFSQLLQDAIKEKLSFT